ncbi:hypothetical protein H6G20_01125 [Desertifilum sp. FACHB-1129]|uniref:Tetratricopeptide repeat protein n=2 Tax=Desertifilum tharense IPPAS B-1220 TaxID=1781255 RepID=A0A1E5QG17_9CYAN|nr:MULTISPECIES: hypothetical protein [Desertifilum]MDA0210337.1 hypothetical protein [Cyanobacteria bacterium FC1]MBD2310284.1 hypothetical protein [Desertifilum sp. FACHB-1129]MBD2322660.1 hypothetical protein [Desertifilum sp. FACHB-866]MBD2333538.1 hypothetical protein [Desertifilum sp. FACHB-868]OEJ73558.1 hypothetical protein BH720_19060 [Desertifilum tharense IPPAS B-1220]
MRRFFLALLLLVSLLYSPLAAVAVELTPQCDRLGEFHHPISTDSPLTQCYFDRGLVLTYGFNHAEAARSFQQAAQLDPDCAMCYWGMALVLGPNINAAMDSETIPEAWQALQRALLLSPKASQSERDYIQALTQRYSLDATADRASLDIAYAEAMRELSQHYSEDLDAATLFVEALMDMTPWDYWTPTGEPNAHTMEILTTLESVLARNPNHIGANHLYVHAVETSPYPERGIESADRLGDLVPASGHLVHVPSHIYIRVGRYHDAAIANQRAIEADRAYLSQDHAQGIYTLAYVLHNYHFLWASATMEGQSQVAIQAARDLSARVNRRMMRQPGYGTLQHFYVLPLYALTRFGKWDEILMQPSPATDLEYPTGVWHYARGMAFVGKGELEKAAQELENLSAIASHPALKDVTIWEVNNTQSLLQIASQMLAGELAGKQGEKERAIAHLNRALTLEDALNYDEPETWYSPVRQSLGAILLEANQPNAAEKVYQADLAQHPENGWSLFGLMQSLQAQGKLAEAKAVQKRLQTAWQYADVTLTASRF